VERVRGKTSDIQWSREVWGVEWRGGRARGGLGQERDEVPRAATVGSELRKRREWRAGGFGLGWF
jgi:hypothetical protein